MSQQLSGKAADTIYGRVVALAGGPGLLTPATLRAPRLVTFGEALHVGRRPGPPTDL